MVETITALFGDTLGGKIFSVFCLSMFPIIELRGGIPVGVARELPFWINYTACVIGNMLPVPFIILFAKQVLEWLSKFEKVGKPFRKIIAKADEKATKFGKYELLALMIFVAIPAPGTGAWTGSLIAAILRLRFWPAVGAVFAGVLISGLIMSLISYGFLGAITLFA